MLFVAFFAAVAAAVVLITFLQTRVDYGALPDRVPMSIALNGTVNAYGPRAAIWLLPAVQVLCAAIFLGAGYALATNAPGAHGSLRGMAVFAPCVLAILWRAQRLIISGAKSSGTRVSIGGFWLFFVVMMAAGSFAIVFL